MMSAPKKQQNPILREVLVTSLQLVLGLIGGVLICAAWLVFKPVTIMDGPPSASREVTDRHEVLYVRGRPALRGAQGARKQKAFLDQNPGELVFAEEDVNRWFAGAYGSKERSFPIKGTGVNFIPRVPSARIIEDELQLGLEIAMERGESARTFVVQTRGRFVERSGEAVFVPREIHLGSCPLPWNLGGSLLYNRLLALHPTPENVRAAWEAVSEARLVDNRLRLTIGTPAASAPALVENEPDVVTAPAAAVATPAAEIPASASDPVSESAATPTDLPASDIPPSTATETPASSATETIPAATEPAPAESTPSEPAAPESSAPAGSESTTATPGAPSEETPASAEEQPAAAPASADTPPAEAAPTP